MLVILFSRVQIKDFRRLRVLSTKRQLFYLSRKFLGRMSRNRRCRYTVLGSTTKSSQLSLKNMVALTRPIAVLKWYLATPRQVFFRGLI